MSALFSHHNKQFVHTYSSYIVQHNSLRLRMLAYDHMEICISLYHCDWTIYERVIAQFDLEYLIKMGEKRWEWDIYFCQKQPLILCWITAMHSHIEVTRSKMIVTISLLTLLFLPTSKSRYFWGVFILIDVFFYFFRCYGICFSLPIFIWDGC